MEHSVLCCMEASPIRPAPIIHDRGLFEENVQPGGPVAEVEPLNHSVDV